MGGNILVFAPITMFLKNNKKFCYGIDYKDYSNTQVCSVLYLITLQLMIYPEQII